MASKVKQIVIDFEAGEIKGTTQAIRTSAKKVLVDNNVILAGYNLGSFKVGSSLTRNSERLKGRLTPVSYKTKKKDIIDFLELIKESDPKNYERFSTEIETIDFIVVNKAFNEIFPQNEDQKQILNEIIEKNQKLKEEEEKEKARKKKLREEDRQRRKAEKEAKKVLQNN